MEISAIIGNNLQQLRKEQGLSLDQLALKTGVSKAVLSQLENGKANPTINTIWKIATALHVTYSALLGAAPGKMSKKVAYTDLRPPNWTKPASTGSAATIPTSPGPRF